jgi:hypothetical protein
MKISDTVQFYRGRPIEHKSSCLVMGQLIMSLELGDNRQSACFIVVDTRNSEKYIECEKCARQFDTTCPQCGDTQTNPHYRIGGFIRVDPKSIEVYDQKTLSFTRLESD